MNDWNPNLYKRFEKQRTQPAKDLISTLELEVVSRILDIGCGPGNSTEELIKRWPKAITVGIDSSPNMIKQAKETLPNVRFELMNANDDISSLGEFDLIFSNAAIQWMPDHDLLIKKFYASLRNNGALAIQIPNVSDMGIQISVEKTSTNIRWENKFKDDSYLNYKTIDNYYEICSRLSDEVYIWETDYYHVLESHQSIVDWYKSTGMKPYLEALDSDMERKDFEIEVLGRIKDYYNIQSDGKVLFPFKRMFFIVYKV